MVEEMTGDSEIKIDEQGILTVKVNLRRGSQQDARTLAYGTLEVAKEEAAKYFFIEEMKRRKMQNGTGILKPA